ncbi:putative dehydrogenase [Paenibacillus mucilaginosus]|uniref:Gfo/Idh/MocA family protein n=1 Tax=Paenibacillus mucilaginosus TaxID=61624 RepID=UPI003D255826
MRKRQQIGVLGAAAILPRVLLEPVRDIGHLRVLGIASRTRSKAQRVADEYGIPLVFDSYEELLACHEIHWVYILLSNHLHAEWTVKAVEAGKHVLVEKPLCLHSAEMNAIRDAVQKHGVHVLEGLMVQHHPWQAAVKELIDGGTYGRLLEIATRISYLPRAGFETSYRSFPELGGGAFQDLGCYWLQFLQAAVGLDAESCTGRSSFGGPNGCDWTFEAELRYPGGLKASAVTSFELPYKAGHTLIFEEAVVAVDDFFRPNLGFRMGLKVKDRRTGETSKRFWEEQSYYAGQLLFFSDVVEGVREPVSLDATAARIAAGERIYRSAAAGGVTDSLPAARG